ncbi:GTPase-associated protein 1-related protein [Nocardiopsis sp. N85]|uniref:GTPase-associated protein 1-related protein n=1 Tax=Nocardiopsis sp. N85 TaxID=3029400 RepID=UPI00237FA692|nr:GTPase-associated protein 1-related protein [Nocardiopsis sp. N85]MDE3719917.1 GTPase-associated protein 1-related protein [Nocardiopsis sp. N85]
MGFAQLYYTSCEQGLSGYAGYQFNAATPGIDQGVLREVERFTVYEPPRSDPADRVEGHPVNLCYSPDLGGYPVVSRIVSCGPDPSGRPGNYFAHSLVGSGGPLPAELWDADFWVSSPVADPYLPVLEVCGGPLDRARTDVWVRRRPPELVARLLAAVDGAVGGERPVVLVADSATVAHWVAALAHLLPPQRARGLAFATYSASPEETFAHVVGVPPGSDLEPLRGRFTVVDPVLGTMDALPEPSSRTMVVAARSVAAGTVGAEALWRSAGRHAGGREESLADWYPVLTAADLLAHGAADVSVADLRAVRSWLSAAVEWLPAADAASLVGLVVDGGGADDHGLVDLQRVAHRTGSVATIGRLERVLVHRCLDGIATGTPVPAPRPMRSEAVRAAARERITDLLSTPFAGGDDTGWTAPERAAEVLRWARACGLVPSALALERYGRGVVAPLLAAAPPDEDPAPAVAALLGAHPEMRRGTATVLADLPRPRLGALASGPAGALFTDGGGALLRELRRLGTDGRADPARLLADVAAIRAEGREAGAPGVAAHDVDAALLTEVWGPGHGPRAALGSLRVLGPGLRVSSDVAGWVAGAVVAVPPVDAEPSWHALAEELAGHPLRDLLPGEAARALGDRSALGVALAAWANALGSPSRAPERGSPPEEPGRGPGPTGAEERGPWREGWRPAARACPADPWALLDRAHPTVAEVARRTAAAFLLDRWDPETVAPVLRECPESVFEAYRALAARRLRDDPPDVGTAARVYLVAGRPELGRARASDVEREVLLPALSGWRRRHTTQLRRRLPREEAAGFEGWAREHRVRRGLFGSREGRR